MLLSFVWRLSVAYIGPKSRTERARKTKIGIEVANVTRDSDTTFKVKRSKVKVTRPLWSPPCWRVRRLQRWVWERVGREKLLLKLPSTRRRKTLRRPRGRRGAGAYRGGRPPTACSVCHRAVCHRLIERILLYFSIGLVTIKFLIVNFWKLTIK